MRFGRENYLAQMKFYTQILDNKQKKLLPRLSILDEEGLYLAGGTALALHLGHRTSLDFDLYTSKNFDNLKIARSISREFGINALIRKNQPEDTLFAEILGVKISIFYYPYPLVERLTKYEGVRLASAKDIAAMKVAAIVQRGKQRDFIDIYFLLEKFGFKKVLEATYRKYPWYKDMDEIIFRSLTYFSDADKDREVDRIKVLDKNFSWEKAKKKISEEVKKHQLGMLR